MSKSVEDTTTIIERMVLSDHERRYNMNLSQLKNVIIELNTNDDILAQNKLLDQPMDELTKKFSKLPQQLKEKYEVPQQRQIGFCELFSEDYLTRFSPTYVEVNYVGNQRLEQYHNKNFPQSNNFNQRWRFEVGPSNKEPFQHYS